MIRLETETMPFLELIRTLELMKKFGIDKVRGGPFVRFLHTAEDVSMIQKLFESEDYGRRGSETVEKIVLDDDEDKPKRKGTKWTAADHVKLRDLILSKVSLVDAEKTLERSAGAIEAKARALLQESVTKGQTIEQVAEFLNRPTDQVRNILAGTQNLFE